MTRGERPLLSVLMPVYNEVGTVEAAIDAVLAAERPSPLELIVVDDGSTDGTRELLRSRDWPDGARACFGVRVFEGHTSHSFLYVMGNRGVTLAANMLFNVYIKDLMTCHKAIQAGERIYEVPVHYRARATDEGKKLTSLDGLRVIATLLRCRFTRR